MVDYTKAFNTIEWDYIDHVLDVCDFGDKISSLIELSRFKSISKIEQNGNFSDSIQLSSYVFVLCAEISSHVIRACYQRR